MSKHNKAINPEIAEKRDISNSIEEDSIEAANILNKGFNEEANQLADELPVAIKSIQKDKIENYSGYCVKGRIKVESIYRMIDKELTELDRCFSKELPLHDDLFFEKISKLNKKLFTMCANVISHLSDIETECNSLSQVKGAMQCLRYGDIAFNSQLYPRSSTKDGDKELIIQAKNSQAILPTRR